MPIQKLSTYADFEQQQRMLQEQMRKHDLKSVSCPSCSCQFFEQVGVSKYKADHNVILGQEVPTNPPGGEPYKILRCIYCKDILEPRIIHNTRDVLGGDYDQLLDTLEGKLDTRKKEEKKDAIQAEEL